MTTVNTTAGTTQVYRVHIRATPQAVWDAITKPEWTARYGYGGLGEYDLRPGGKYRAMASEEMKRAGQEMGFPTPDVVVDGEVIEADAPHRLVQTWRMNMDPEMVAEGYTRLTYEIKEVQPGVTRLTVRARNRQFQVHIATGKILNRRDLGEQLFEPLAQKPVE